MIAMGCRHNDNHRGCGPLGVWSVGGVVHRNPELSDRFTRLSFWSLVLSASIGKFPVKSIMYLFARDQR